MAGRRRLSCLARLSDIGRLGSLCCCGGSVPYVDFRVRVGVADQVEVDGLAARVVVEPDAVAEQDRCDVEVDLVDQPQFE
jgi:hypothetical protein